MDLIEYYLRTGIEGYRIKTLTDILAGSNPDIHVKNLSHEGSIFLTNNRIIKCVMNYYRTCDKQVTNKDIKSNNNKCFYVQKALGITRVSSYNCTDCHLQCSNKFKAKELLRINDL